MIGGKFPGKMGGGKFGGKMGGGASDPPPAVDPAPAAEVAAE